MLLQKEMLDRAEGYIAILEAIDGCTGHGKWTATANDISDYLLREGITVRSPRSVAASLRGLVALDWVWSSRTFPRDVRRRREAGEMYNPPHTAPFPIEKDLHTTTHYGLTNAGRTVLAMLFAAVGP